MEVGGGDGRGIERGIDEVGEIVVVVGGGQFERRGLGDRL